MRRRNTRQCGVRLPPVRGQEYKKKEKGAGPDYSGLNQLLRASPALTGPSHKCQPMTTTLWVNARPQKLNKTRVEAPNEDSSSTATRLRLKALQEGDVKARLVLGIHLRVRLRQDDDTHVIADSQVHNTCNWQRKKVVKLLSPCNSKGVLWRQRAMSQECLRWPQAETCSIQELL